LCSAFSVLPSSFILPPAFVKRDANHFASGGYSKVYNATFHDRLVVVKVLDAATQTNQERLYRLLVKEVIGWKWLQHDNILPFIGVMLTPSPVSIVSERMKENIMDFIKANQDYNRLSLLVGAVTGLEYLHERNIVHGDLKGANILIDSEYRARLADFGLAALVDFGLTAIVDEMTGRPTAADGKLRGTAQWMAPELAYPSDFGFTGELRKRLPSKDTDTYAIGMTIFEVITGYYPFGDEQDYTVTLMVARGGRPKRPRPGFPDTLWELLLRTWVVQHAHESQRRPSARTILDRLKECVDHWGESIDPIIPEFWQEHTMGSDDVAVRQDVMSDHSDAPVSSGYASYVAKIPILPLVWILGTGITILGGTLVVRGLFL